jgi:hypothetical protein
VGLTAALDTEARGKILSPLPAIKPRSLVFQSTAYTILTELPLLRVKVV